MPVDLLHPHIVPVGRFTGERFAIVDSRAATPGSSQINIILTWFEELKEQAPVR
jgi:hypothetical protein